MDLEVCPGLTTNLVAGGTDSTSPVFYQLISTVDDGAVSRLDNHPISTSTDRILHLNLNGE